MIAMMLHRRSVLAFCTALWASAPGAVEAQTPGDTLVEAQPAAESAGLKALKDALVPSPNGLTEEEVVQAALVNSPAMKKSQIDAEKADVVQARAKLAFLPRVDLAARYTRISDLDIRFGNTVLPQVLDQFANQATLKMPITELFLVIMPTYKGTELLSEVAEHQERAKQSSVAYDARAAFYDFIRAQGALVVATDSIQVLDQSARDLEALASRGAATATDVIRARAALSRAQVMQAERQGIVEVSAVRLTRILGTDVDLKRGVAEPLVEFEPGPTPQAGDVVTSAFAQRHELLALRSLQRAREKMTSAKRGGQWPVLSAMGNVYYSSPNPRIFPQTNEFRETWDVGASLSWSPNDFMLARSQAQDSETDLAQVAQDLRMLEDAIAVEATMAVTSHRTARERIEATTQNLEANLRYMTEQQNLLKAGAATLTNVLDAEAELRRAQLEWVDAYVQARLATAALIKARGETGLTRGPRSSR
jgi:outer membrane protein TolC